MFKLTVISGKKAGTSYSLKDGENTIGRKDTNVIVLPSSKISKQHCVVEVNGGEVMVIDSGSSNGTFVNGVLSKRKSIGSGDRISVGGIVMELREAVIKAPHQAPAVVGLGNIVEFPKKNRLATADDAAPTPDAGDFAAPQDLKGKLMFIFERYVMSIFYGFNLTQDWRTLTAAVFGVFVLVSLIVSVHPLIELNQLTLDREAGRRGRFIAQEIARSNARFLASNLESKTSVGAAPFAEGVRFAVLTGLDNRIIAPEEKRNQHLTYGEEAKIAHVMSTLFRKGRETGVAKRVSDDTVVAVEPVKVFNSGRGQNEVVAMAVVSIDTAMAKPSMGAVGILYSKTLIITGFLGLFVFLIIYRLTLKPFEILNEDIDKVVKGDANQVSRNFKIDELNSLWDVINSSLQRIPKGGEGIGGGDGFDGGGAGGSDNVGATARALGEEVDFGVMACDQDRRIIYINPTFEEITGMREADSLDQDVTVAARDEAFSALSKDIFDQSEAALGQPVSEPFEFGGISFKVTVTALGTGGPTGYLMTIKKDEV